MRRLWFGIRFCVLLLVAGGAFAASAHAAGGFAIPPADGSVGIAAPDGGSRYYTVGTRGTNLVVKFEDERIDARRGVPSQLAIPAVTLDGDPAGLSADGDTLVLSDFSNAFADRSDFLLLRTRDLSTIERARLDGSFVFDAISPDGKLVYLVHLFDPRNPLDYDVRIYDVEAGRLLREPVVDPSQPDEQMGGYPYARAASADGRWAYTLYDGGHEPFIHALDTVGRTAACIDLDELGVPIGNGSTLEVSEDGSSLLLGSRGEPAATIDTETFEVAPVEQNADPAAADGGEGSSGDPWALVAAIAALTLIVAALLRWKVGAGRPPDYPDDPEDPVSTPSDSSPATNASASTRARSGSIP